MNYKINTKLSLYTGTGQLKCDGTRAEIRFRLSAKRTSPFKSAGASVQSTTGSRGVRISDSNSGYTMFRGSVKGTDYPLHSPVSPSLPLPCVTVCCHISTGVYLLQRLPLHYKHSALCACAHLFNLQQTAIISLYSITWLLHKMHTSSVHPDVGTELFPLTSATCNLRSKMFIKPEPFVLE